MSAVIFRELIHIEQSKISQSLLSPNAVFVTGNAVAPKVVDKKTMPFFAFGSPTLILIIVKMRKLDRQTAKAKKDFTQHRLNRKWVQQAAIICYQSNRY